MKTFKEIERIVKGFSNHRRIQILKLLSEKPELSVCEVTGFLKINFRTASDHIRKLTVAGLVMKRSNGNSVRHALTKRGKSVLVFCGKLE